MIPVREEAGLIKFAASVMIFIRSSWSWGGERLEFGAKGDMSKRVT